MSEPLELARSILDGNWRDGHTVPAAGLYPHQWSWDSCFIAIGLRHHRPDRAQSELLSLLDAQWDDGRIPQIVFDPRSTGYEPGPEFWRSQDIPGSPSVPTAGFVQPPVHAMAVQMVARALPETAARDFLRRCYPALLAWHRYLTEHRTGPGGLVEIVHPWESGTDDSPLWDAALARIPAEAATRLNRPDLQHAGEGERPSNREYLRYFALAEQYRDGGCRDDPAFPFRMQDPLMTTLVARSESALASIAREIGEDPRAHEAREIELTSALEALYLPTLGCYGARDSHSGELIVRATVSGLAPLMLPGVGHRDELLATLRGPRFLGGGARLVPGYDATADDFDPARYWRGPAWFNMNWLLITALRELGDADPLDAELAAALTRQFLAIAPGSDFAEYVDPFTGAGHGTRRFSWTAALTVDLLGSGAG